jgi:hypothetical protein
MAAKDLIAEADAREAAAKAARVTRVTAEHEAKAAIEKANMKAASSRKGRAVTDAEATKMRDSMGTAAKKPKGQLGKKARAAKAAEITNPPASVKPYDFETAKARNPGVNVTSKPMEPYRGGVGSDTESGLTKNMKVSKPAAPPAASQAVAIVTDETPTQGFKQPDAKPASAAKPEVAQVDAKGKLKPRPQGAMEGKPVTQMMDSRGAHIARDPKGTLPKGMTERRAPAAQAVQAPKAAPASAPPVEIGGGKAMTPSGQVTSPPKVAPAAVSSPTAGTTPKVSADDLFGPKDAPAPSASVPKMTPGDLFGSPKASFATKATNYLKGMPADVAKTSWEMAKAFARSADPTREYRALGAARTSAQVAEAGLKGSFRVAKAGTKLALAGIATDFVGQMAYKAGGAINKGPGQAQDATFDPFTAPYHVAKAATSAAMNEGELARLRSGGRKQGLTVSGGDSGMKAVGKGLVGALTLGRVDLGNEIKVTEAPGAKSLREKRLAKGEAKFQANKAKSAPKAEEFSEANYRKLKQTASRNVIKGSYQG